MKAFKVTFRADGADTDTAEKLRELVQVALAQVFENGADTVDIEVVEEERT